jgi:hypothetical protein
LVSALRSDRVGPRRAALAAADMGGGRGWGRRVSALKHSWSGTPRQRKGPDPLGHLVTVQDVRFASLNTTRAVGRTGFLANDQEHDAVAEVEDVLWLVRKLLEGIPPLAEEGTDRCRTSYTINPSGDVSYTPSGGQRLITASISPRFIASSCRRVSSTTSGVVDSSDIAGGVSRRQLSRAEQRDPDGSRCHGLWKLYGSAKRQQTATDSTPRRPRNAEIARFGFKQQQTASDRADFTRERSQVRNPPHPLSLSAALDPVGERPRLG